MALEYLKEIKSRPDLRPDREMYAAVMKALERHNWSYNGNDVFSKAIQVYADAEAAGIYSLWSDDGTKLDLHNGGSPLSAAEARVVLAYALRSYGEGTRPLPEVLTVITGRGIHSEKGRGVLRHVASKVFAKQNIKVDYDEKNTGLFYVPRAGIEMWKSGPTGRLLTDLLPLRLNTYADYFDND